MVADLSQQHEEVETGFKKEWQDIGAGRKNWFTSELARRFVADKNSGLGKVAEREKARKHLQANAEISNDVKESFKRYVRSEVLQRSQSSYGLTQAAGESDDAFEQRRQERVEELSTQRMHIFEKTVRQSITWEEAQEQKKIDLIVEEVKPGLLSTQDDKKLREGLDNIHLEGSKKTKDAVLAEILTQESTRQFWLSRILGYIPKVAAPKGEISELASRIFQQLRDSSDPKAQEAMKLFQAYVDGTEQEYIPKEAFTTLLQVGALSEADIDILMREFFPVVSYAELSAIASGSQESQELARHMIDAFEVSCTSVDPDYEKIDRFAAPTRRNAEMEEVITSAREHFVQQMKGFCVSWKNLSSTAKRALLTKFGGQKISERIERISDPKEVSPEQFAMHLKSTKNLQDLTEEDIGTKDRMRNICMLYNQERKWVDTSEPFFGHLQNLEQGNVIEVTYEVGRKEYVKKYMRIDEFPPFAHNPDPEWVPESFGIFTSLLGTDKEIMRYAYPPRRQSFRDFFYQLTRNEVKQVRFLRDVPHDPHASDAHDTLQSTHVPELKNPLIDTLSFEEMQDKLSKTLDHGEGLHLGVGSILSFAEHDGTTTYLSVSHIDQQNHTITFHQGEWHPDVTMNFFDLTELAERVHGQKDDTFKTIKYQHGYCSDEKGFNGLLGHNHDIDHKVLEVFKGFELTKAGFEKSGSSRKEGESAYNILKVDGKSDLWIREVRNGQVLVSLGTYVEPKKNKDGKFEGKWGNGSKPHWAPLTTLLSFIHNKKPVRLYQEKEVIQEPVSLEQKPSLLKAILAIGRLGAIPNIISKPFEAAKADFEAEIEVSGNQAARLLLDSIPVVRGWNFDWMIQLRANTSRTIKSKIDELVEQFGGAYSLERQRHIRKWAKKYNMPHIKFMAAMMGTLKEYGQFYYNTNMNAPEPGESECGLPPFFFYVKCRPDILADIPGKPEDFLWTKEGLDWLKKRLVNDELFKQDARRAGNMDDRDEITEDMLFSINEVELTGAAFARLSGRYPQYSNLGRMYEKYRHSGAHEHQENGWGNLESKNDRERMDWMVDQVVSARQTEFVSGLTKYWFKEAAYEAKFYYYPIILMWMLNRCCLCPEETMDYLRTFAKENGIHATPLFFTGKTSEIITFRKAAVVIAYSVHQDLGDMMLEMFEQSQNTRLDKKAAKSLEQRFKWVWEIHGTEFVDKLGMTKNTSVLTAELAGHASHENLHKRYVKNESTRKKMDEQGFFDEIHNYIHGIQHKFAEESTAQMRGRIGYDSDFFRISSTNGIPAWLISGMYTYVDKNFDNAAFWRGQAGLQWDGLWTEFMRVVEGIPKHSYALAKQLYPDATGAEFEKRANQLALTLYEYIKYGQAGHNPPPGDGLLRVMSRSALAYLHRPEASNWNNEAVIYHLAESDYDENGNQKPDAVVREDNIISFIKQGAGIRKIYGMDGSKRTRSREEMEAKGPETGGARARFNRLNSKARTKIMDNINVSPETLKFEENSGGSLERGVQLTDHQKIKILQGRMTTEEAIAENAQKKSNPTNTSQRQRELIQHDEEIG